MKYALITLQYYETIVEGITVGNTEEELIKNFIHAVIDAQFSNYTLPYGVHAYDISLPLGCDVHSDDNYSSSRVDELTEEYYKDWIDTDDGATIQLHYLPYFLTPMKEDGLFPLVKCQVMVTNHLSNNKCLTQEVDTWFNEERGYFIELGKSTYEETGDEITTICLPEEYFDIEE